MKARLSLTVNGETHDVLVPVHKTLLEVLREDLGLTGTKHGCELGECGTCTVLVDAVPVLPCLAPPDDLFLPRMAYGRLLRSPHGHARITRVDTARARALPGVYAVISGADLPRVRFGILPVSQDEEALCTEKVRMVGDAVAAVAAVDEDTAEHACRLI